jgi:hypothetical protein
MRADISDLSYNVLGIRWKELTYEKIQTFFDIAQYENERLEFKSYGPGKTLDKWYLDLAIEICAFLNSDGGILIWGAPQEDKDSIGRFAKGELTPINPALDKEDLLRRIIGKIKELPNAIELERVPEPNGTGSIYVFQIHASEYRPHQAADVYYMRIGSEKRPAPHHYVEAMMKRIKYPRLNGRLDFVRFKVINKIGQGFSRWIRVDLNVIIENSSPFQNEESPRFILYCHHGTPLRGSAPWPQPEITAINRPFFDPTLEVIHYGERFQRSYSLGFEYNNLESEGFQSDVALKFGGRFSPLKLCHYRLDLSFFDPMKYIEDVNYPIEYKPTELENGLIFDSKYGEQYYDLWESIDYPNPWNA